MITGDNYMNGPNFYLTLTPDERHDLLKLTVNERGLFRKIYEASATLSRPFYDASNLAVAGIPYVTGANNL